MSDLIPRAIVAALDRHIVGQEKAKRCVAIALRNRWRRRQLPPEVRDEISPRNILLIGPTGVGKTEIARRLAALARAPFVKVEVTKYTEVGYVGRDVESMVRDLLDASLAMVRREHRATVEEEAGAAARRRLLDAIQSAGVGALPPGAPSEREAQEVWYDVGRLEEVEVEIEVTESSEPQVLGALGMEQMGIDLQGLMERLQPPRRRKRRMPVQEARRLLVDEEAGQRVDDEKAREEALRRAEQDGIIFLDEMDKIATTGDVAGSTGPQVSRGGVQRDLLPIVEGTSVATRHGTVRTDHILFIAAGAFHSSRPSDLIPELQGRFPIRVELEDLDAEDFARILTEPESALTRQYRDLLGTEQVKVEFTPDAVRAIAEVAAEMNRRVQSTGARRLATVMEQLLEEVSFEAPDMRGVDLQIDAAFVQRRLSDIVADEELSHYIL